MFLPMSMKVTGDSLPEGTVEKKCRYCQTSFAVPSEEVETYKNDVCEECKPEFDKDVAAASAALMKNPTDAAATIKTALGK